MGWSRLRLSAAAVAVVAACTTPEARLPDPPTTTPSATAAGFQEYDVPAGSQPHDVAVTADGIVWYTAQGSGELGRLDPATGNVTEVPLGPGSRPHGVVVGRGDDLWVTDSGQNAIVRVDAQTRAVRVFPLPEHARDADLNTPAVDRRGTVWFTGQNGVVGRLTPATGRVEAFDALGGRGPYGITTTADGLVYYASLAAHNVMRIDPARMRVMALHPPTRRQGTRRVWADSRGRIWCSQWVAGQVAVYDPATKKWRELRLPGSDPQAYAVYVDDRDVVWLSDFGANALVRFDPETERFTSFPLPSNPGNVRQIHGRPGEVWGAESAADKLVVLRTPRG